MTTVYGWKGVRVAGLAYDSQAEVVVAGLRRRPTQITMNQKEAKTEGKEQQINPTEKP